MMNRFTLPLDAAANGLALGSVAFAGPQYLDGTGYAVSGFDVVAHSRQDLAPADRSRPAAVPGNSNLWRFPIVELQLGPGFFKQCTAGLI